MASQVLFYCDHCREVIDEGRVRLDSMGGHLPSRRPTLDFCPTCAQALEAWLAAGGEGFALDGDQTSRPARSAVA